MHGGREGEGRGEYLAQKSSVGARIPKIMQTNSLFLVPYAAQLRHLLEERETG